jgi:anti-sigma factor ChrR (cupin superfamily)
MKTETTRLCVYPKDVQRITGKSERWGRMLLLKIRESLNKQEHQFVSIEEFCIYTGLKIDQVQTLLIG